MSVKTNPVTVRLDPELHKEASAIAKVTGETFRGLVETGLRSVVTERLKDGRLAEAVRTLTRYERTVEG